MGYRLDSISILYILKKQKMGKLSNLFTNFSHIIFYDLAKTKTITEREMSNEPTGFRKIKGIQD